jgi:glycosyltransferase involved in cell wall biosynthesis
MRILMLAPPPEVHGPLPKLAPLLASALRALGCEVSLAPWGGRREGEPARNKPLQRLADIERVRRWLARQAFDVLVIHTAHDWKTLSRDIPLLLATRGRSRRVVLQFHGSRCDRLLASGRPAFKLASAVLVGLTDAAFVLSSEEQRQWHAFHPRGRFVQVSNPCPPAAALDSVPTRCQLALPADPPIALFVGRLIEEKGLRDLTDALAQMRVPVHLLAVGAGPLEAVLRQGVLHAGGSMRLTLAGYLEGRALQTAHQLADVFVLPTYWPEGFPLAIVEAMAAGLPVVTTRMRGMADHLREGVNALFVPPRAPAALAAALTRLLSDPALRSRMGEANRQKAREFAPEIVARHYLDALGAIVAGGEASGEVRGTV